MTSPPVPLRLVLALLTAGFAVVGLAVVGLAGPAAAHDALISVAPADASTVDVAPDAVVLEFAEPAVALGTEVQVLGPDGVNLATGDPALEGTTVSQALATDRPAGAYLVLWRVTSDDGHAVTGQFTFTVTAATGGPAATPTPEPTPTPSATDTSPSPTATPTGSEGTVVTPAPPRGEGADDAGGSGRTIVLALVGLVVLGGAAFGVVGMRRLRGGAAG